MAYTFKTDSSISRFCEQEGEKDLVPWDCPEESEDYELDISSSGWDANDMFRKNRDTYGVVSNFDHELPGYTMPLRSEDSESYREAEAKADKIVKEMKNQNKLVLDTRTDCNYRNYEHFTKFSQSVLLTPQRRDQLLPRKINRIYIPETEFKLFDGNFSSTVEIRESLYKEVLPPPGNLYVYETVKNAPLPSGEHTGRRGFLSKLNPNATPFTPNSYKFSIKSNSKSELTSCEGKASNVAYSHELSSPVPFGVDSRSHEFNKIEVKPFTSEASSGKAPAEEVPKYI